MMVAQSTPDDSPDTTVLPIIGAVALGHLLNDLMQSLIPAIYPILKADLALSFAQIGLITLVFQGTASILQPLVGLLTDRRPLPYALAAGMASTGTGLVLLAHGGSYGAVLLAVALIGLGSSIFHPESTRIARLAAGQRPGFAQSVFQLGGNAGSSLGPLAAALVVLPHGQSSIEWFAGCALAGMALMTLVGRWFVSVGAARLSARRARVAQGTPMSRGRVAWVLALLIALMFSKFVYTGSYSSFFTFFLIEQHGVSVGQSQLYLFVFLVSVAVGTFIGGPIGDRIGRKRVIWVSILGVLPLSLAVPHLPLVPAVATASLAGLIMASAFPAIIVYAQELLPLRVGMVGGLFFGLAFGMGAIGAAGIGWMADQIGIVAVYKICAWLPAIGLIAALLPDLRTR
jgi:MFS transporter, FSR family, fosmidomycin resistance protein